MNDIEVMDVEVQKLSPMGMYDLHEAFQFTKRLQYGWIHEIGLCLQHQ